jgi:hypothetical protein
MKRSSVLSVGWALLATTFSLAASTPAPPRASGPAPSTRPARPGSFEPKTIPTEANKSYLHASTGFDFPFNVGAFRREKVVAFDEAGKNVAVGYADPSLKIILTLYVYPHYGLPADAHFKQVKGDIVRINAKATLVDDGPVTIEQGAQKRDGLRAKYTFIGELAGVEQDLVSEAYLFVHGGNFVKFRLTYPATEQKTAKPRIDTFLQSLAFPEAGASTKPAPKALKDL